MIEKPAPQDAPSDLAVLGRYILLPNLFDLIENLKPGVGGEIQLTDALSKLLILEGLMPSRQTQIFMIAAIRRAI